MMTSIWKRVLDAQKQHLSVSARALPPGDQPVQVVHFILTSLGYADDTYGLAAGGTPLTPLLQCTEEWLQDTGQGVMPKSPWGSPHPHQSK